MKISLRVQIVGLGTLVLVAGMLAYLALAIRLVSRDKLAYVYDASGALVAARAEELRANLGALADRLQVVAEQGRQQGDAAVDLTVRSLVRADPQLLAVELWHKRGQSFERRYRFISQEALAQAGLPLGAIAALHDSEPLPFARLQAGELVVRNNSIPPDIPLLTLAVADATRQQIVVADLQPQRLMRLFGSSAFHTTYAIDSRGALLLHPDIERMVTNPAPPPASIVETAFAPKIERGVQEVDTAAGTLITAFARAQSGLAVIAELPKARALRAVTDLVTQATIFAALVLLIALVLTLLSSQRIVAPLRRLHQAAARISQGNLDVTLPVGGSAEVAALTDSFNRMSAALADRETRYLGLVGSLGGGVAHEINNPLAVIMINQSFVADQLDAAIRGGKVPASAGLTETLAAVREAQAAAKRVKGIVSDLQAFACMADEPQGAVDVGATIDAALNLVENELRYRARLVKTYAPGAVVLGSRAQLGQVFVNLLVFAARAIPEGDAPNQEVRVEVKPHADVVLIEISDTGRGLPPETVTRVFDPFFSAGGTDAPIGLALCHSIVTRMGGAISLESTVGQGTSIRLSLPKAPADVVVTRQTPAPEAAPRRGRVLVVDDDLLVRGVIGRLLETEHDVTLAADATDALAKIAASPDYDLVLCDLLMPNVTGMDLHHAVSERVPALAERIVFMTGAAFTTRAEEFLKAVPNRCLRKPFDLDELRRLAAEHAARRAP